MQKYTLSMIPSAVPFVVNASAGDSGREISIVLIDGPSVWGGITATLETESQTAECTVDSSTSTVTCVIPEAMATAGTHRAQIALHNGTEVIRSSVFILEIEKEA